MHTKVPLFGPIHLAILASVVLLGLVSAWMVRRKPVIGRPLRWVFAIVSSILGLSWYLLRYTVLHSPLRWDLPLEVCDLALWITVAALIYPRQRLLELAYYWGLTGASMALVTPYLTAPLTSLSSLTFFAGHGMIVASVIFLLGTGRMRPSPGSWRFALLVLNGIALVDFCVDRWLGTNYMYLLRKPPIASLLSIMGPWPWYILAADALAAALFLGLQWPFRRADVSRPY
ncbi:MAG TPA: TIGR02206 family membrane protein [Acidobacteriaceae bacterium]|jgi:hypothetical integral membrane protein (TIGR02206 family)|nr:TIGR02206 family membrane protein [Acidobacteriaceae bacterium]